MQNRLYITIFVAALTFFSGCNHTPKTATQVEQVVTKDTLKSDFPEAINVDKLIATEVVPTLENNLTDNKNAVYAPAFLFVWDEIKQILKFPIKVGKTNSTDFKLINQSKSHEKSLTKEEYTSEAKFVGGTIEAKAYFKKSLPFYFPFQKLEDKILFGNVKVAAFGIKKHDDALTDQIDILYYKDENQFVIKIIPAEREHEIILAKGIKLTGRFADLIKETQKLISKGKREMYVHPNDTWRWAEYRFGDSDLLSIPIIKFNIETYYPNLTGQQFKYNNISTGIGIAYQRTGFLLDENGAKVDSKAYGDVSFHFGDLPPKKFIFDKPYFLMLKRKDCKNPYLAVKIDNSEFMEKE